MQIKVLTWNIWQGKYLPEIIDFLKKADADIIGLQEINETENGNIAQIIAKELGCSFAYYRAVIVRSLGRKQGNAILTKHKIIEKYCHFLSDESLYQGNGDTEPRIAVQTVIDCKGVKVNTLNTHLALSSYLKPSEIRQQQLTKLLLLLHEKKTILTGDFNALPDSKTIKQIGKLMQNTDNDSIQPTWTIYPFKDKDFVETQLIDRIDYIFISHDLRAIKTTVEKSKASDHLPVSAIIEV